MAGITSLQTNDWQVALIVAAHNAVMDNRSRQSMNAPSLEYANEFARLYQAMYAACQGRTPQASESSTQRDR